MAERCFQRSFNMVPMHSVVLLALCVIFDVYGNAGTTLQTISNGVIENSSCPHKCHCYQNNTFWVICNDIVFDTFPRILPNGTAHVKLFLRDNAFSQTKGLFVHDSWNQVISLSIFGKIHHINETFFVGLKSVNSLTVSDSKLQTMHENSCWYLPRLEHLDLSFNEFLSYNTVLTCIEQFKNRSLKFVNLMKIHQKYSPKKLDQEFYERFSGVKVEVLNLVSSNIFFIESGITKSMSSLRFLNISHNVILGELQALLEVLNLPNLEILDNSYTSSMDQHTSKISPVRKSSQKRFHNSARRRVSQSNIANLFRAEYSRNTRSINGWLIWIALKSLCISMTPSLKELYFHHIGSSLPIDLNGNYCFDPRNNLRGFWLNNWGFRKINCTFTNLNKLEVLDLSENRLDYACPAFFSRLPSLKSLNLRANNLWKMERDFFSDFSNLFLSNINLEHLDLSGNLLQNIPEDMFRYNVKLTTLHLSGNAIEKISLKLGQGFKIRFIDLSHNNLLTIDPSLLLSLDNILAYRNITKDYPNAVITNTNTSRAQRNDTSSKDIVLDISYNNIKCECSEKDLMKWAFRTRVKLIEESSSECPGKYKLRDAYKKIIAGGNNCYDEDEMLLIILVCSASGGLISVALLVLCYFCRRWKRNTMRIQQCQNQNLDFIAFVAYCHKDKEFVLRHVLRNLENRLKALLGQKEGILCINDRDFKLGHRIDDEVFRCVSSSLITILIISDSFLESVWCEFETDLAWRQRKPIFLVFRHEVEKQRLPTILREAFNDLTRLVWPQNESDQEQFWNVLCQSILKLVPQKLAKREMKSKTEIPPA